MFLWVSFSACYLWPAGLCQRVSKDSLSIFCPQHSGFVCGIQCSSVNRLQWTVAKPLVNGSVDLVELFGRSRCPWNRSAMFTSRSE